MAFIYNLFKRSSTFTLSILAATFFFERGFDMIGDTIFDRLNEGVCINIQIQVRNIVYFKNILIFLYNKLIKIVLVRSSYFSLYNKSHAQSHLILCF